MGTTWNWCIQYIWARTWQREYAKNTQRWEAKISGILLDRVHNLDIMLIKDQRDQKWIRGKFPFCGECDIIIHIDYCMHQNTLVLCRLIFWSPWPPMRMQILNGEEYPPYQKDVNVTMYYPPHVPQHLRFALGHPFFALLPGMLLLEIA